MEERWDQQGWGRREGLVNGKLKLFLGVAVLAFIVTLAVVVGNRLSDEALGVLAGAVCGVGAAIPTSLIIVAVSQRRHEEAQVVQSPVPQQGVYPPVIVVAPQGGQQPYGWGGPPPSLTAPLQRQFTVVGGMPPMPVGAPAGTPVEVGAHEPYL